MDEQVRKILKENLVLDINENMLEEIKDDIIIDNILKHKYRESIKNLMYSCSLGLAVKSIVNGRNFPFSRVSDRIIETLKNNPKYRESNLNAFKIHYKDGGDLMDTELVHLATVGYFFEGKRYPVDCYTCDNISTISDRISSYRYILKYAFNSIEREKVSIKDMTTSKQIKNYRLTPGRVFCFDHDINNPKILNVETIPEFSSLVE